MDPTYSSGLARNAFAVLTDILSQGFVNIAIGLTDLIEILLIGTAIICIVIILFTSAIESLIVQNRYKGNEVLKLIYKILRRVYLFFFFITVRFFVVILTLQILVLNIVWYTLLSYVILILAWLFISIKD
jgi:hypothetical protein